MLRRIPLVSALCFIWICTSAFGHGKAADGATRSGPQAPLFFRTDWQPVAGLPTGHAVAVDLTGMAKIRTALDIENLVTRGRRLGKVDLGNVGEIGFADLLPASGHGDGGYTGLGFLEVYGKPVPRAGGGQKAQPR